MLKTQPCWNFEGLLNADPVDYERPAAKLCAESRFNKKVFAQRTAHLLLLPLGCPNWAEHLGHGTDVGSLNMQACSVTSGNEVLRGLGNKRREDLDAIGHPYDWWRNCKNREDWRAIIQVLLDVPSP